MWYRRVGVATLNLARKLVWWSQWRQYPGGSGRHSAPAALSLTILLAAGSWKKEEPGNGWRHYPADQTSVCSKKKYLAAKAMLSHRLARIVVQAAKHALSACLFLRRAG